MASPTTTAFTQEELTYLRCFCKVADDIAKCRFYVDLPKQSSAICLGRTPDGRVYDEYPRYDEQDFRAFLTYYRKLRLGKDFTNLFRIMKLLKSKGDPEDQAKLDHFKDEIRIEGECYWYMISRRDENGERVPVTQNELEEMILYGEVMHYNDLNTMKMLAEVAGSMGLMKLVAVSNYMRFVLTVVGYAFDVRDLIRSRGYLN